MSDVPELQLINDSTTQSLTIDVLSVADMYDPNAMRQMELTPNANADAAVPAVDFYDSEGVDSTRANGDRAQIYRASDDGNSQAGRWFESAYHSNYHGIKGILDTPRYNSETGEVESPAQVARRIESLKARLNAMSPGDIDKLEEQYRSQNTKDLLELLELSDSPQEQAEILAVLSRRKDA